MCFSANISLSFGIIKFIFFIKKNMLLLVIFYFALMEILHFFQYKVINQCNNDYNKFLTNIGYIHICFQPLFFNLWLFAFISKPNFTYLYMSIFAGLLISRLFFVKDKELCDSNNEPLYSKKTYCLERKIASCW